MRTRFFVYSLLLPVLLLASSALVADCGEKSGRNCFYLYGAGGGTFPRCADICVDTDFWPDVEEGYDSDFGNTGFLEYGLGYEWCDWFSLIATGQYRGTLDFCISQSDIPFDTSLTNSGTDSGTRFFSLDTHTFMLSALLDVTSACGCEDWDISFVVGGGIGATNFHVFDFHTVLDTPDDNGDRPVMDIAITTSNYDFSAQAFAGLEYTTCDWFQIGVGYRFFHGGDFCTNDYVINSFKDIDGNAIEVPAWQGRLQAHEVYLYFYCSY